MKPYAFRRYTWDRVDGLKSQKKCILCGLRPVKRIGAILCIKCSKKRA